MANTPSLGTNLNGTTYYTTHFPYVDLMRQASGFDSQPSSSSNSNVALNLDPSGWVMSLPTETWAGVYPILHNPAGADIAGDRFVVTYDGDGTFQGSLSSTISESSPGRFVLTASLDGTLGFQITSTNPNDYVRNMHVVREDQSALFNAGQVWNPEFLEKVENFHTLRFMDVMKTNDVHDAAGYVAWPESNNASDLEWADRPLMSDAQWTKGVPVEAMVELSNAVGADAWFNMPINASDDYVRQFAVYVRDHLNPGLEVHVEFSNEVWNWGFPQAHYAEAHDAPFGNWMEWYGVRTAQVGKIWNEVFGESPTGGEDVTGRVHVVYNTQAAWKGLESYGLETLNWYENGVHVRAGDYFDEYAITGYYNFNTADHDVVRSWWSNPDGGFDAAVKSLRENVDGPLKEAYAYHAGVAVEYGLELTTYESGYGEVDPNETPEYQQFLIDVQRQPELYDIELANYQNFKDAGGGLYMNFGVIGAPSKWGSWSALESLYQETSPRYQALVDWNAMVAPWYESGRDPSSFDSLSMQMNNDAPTINSNGGGDTATVSVAENTTAVTTVTTTGLTIGQAVGYSIQGGVDATKFTIGASTGMLSFVTAPDHEAPTDAGGNNVYDVVVQASYGGGAVDTQAIAVNVQNVLGAIIQGTPRNDRVDMMHSVSGQPHATSEEDFFYGRGGGDTLAGGPGRDTFVFDLTALSPGHRKSGFVDHVVDYNQGNSGTFNPAEGDAFVFSGLLSTQRDLPISSLVRVTENPSGTAALLQIDRDGTANGTHWKTVAQLNGVHAGDGINVIFESPRFEAVLTVAEATPSPRPMGICHASIPARDWQHIGNFEWGREKGSVMAAILQDIQVSLTEGHLTPITDASVPAHFGNWYV